MQDDSMKNIHNSDRPYTHLTPVQTTRTACLWSGICYLKTYCLQFSKNCLGTEKVTHAFLKRPLGLHALSLKLLLAVPRLVEVPGAKTTKLHPQGGAHCCLPLAEDGTPQHRRGLPVIKN